MKKYMIDKGCKLCDACIWACPKKAIFSNGTRAIIEQMKCSHCGICKQNCPNEAISAYEVEKNLNEN